MPNNETTLYQKFHETIKHGLIYGFGSIIQRIAGVFLIPLYTACFSTSEYGVFGLLMATSQIFGVFILAGMSTAFMRSFYDYQDRAEKRMVASTAMSVIFVNSLGIGLLGLLFSKQIAMFLFQDAQYGIYIVMVVFMAIFYQLNSIPLAIFRVKKKSILYISCQITFFLFQIGAVVYFVAIRQMGIFGAIYGYVLASLALFVILIIVTRKDITFRFSFYEARKMLHYGVPLLLTGLSAFLFNYIDRYMLAFYASFHEVGLYNLGYQFGMIMMAILVTPMKFIWGPMFLSVKDHSNAHAFYARMLTYLTCVGSLLFLMLAVLSKDVIQLFAKQSYWDAYHVVPVIALSYLIWSQRSVLDVAIHLKRKTKISAFYFIAGAMINIVLNLALIPRYQMMGAAYATLIAFVAMVIASYVINQRLIKIDYEWNRILKIYSTAILIYFVTPLINISNVYLSLLTKSGFIIVCFPLLLMMLGFYTSIELEKIKKILRIT